MGIVEPPVVVSELFYLQFVRFDEYYKWYKFHPLRYHRRGVTSPQSFPFSRFRPFRSSDLHLEAFPSNFWGLKPNTSAPGESNSAEKMEKKLTLEKIIFWNLFWSVNVMKMRINVSHLCQNRIKLENVWAWKRFRMYLNALYHHQLSMVRIRLCHFTICNCVKLTSISIINTVTSCVCTWSLSIITSACIHSAGWFKKMSSRSVDFRV